MSEANRNSVIITILLKAFYLVLLFIGAEEYASRIGLFRLSNPDFIGVLVLAAIASISTEGFWMYFYTPGTNADQERIALDKTCRIPGCLIYAGNLFLGLAALVNVLVRLGITMTTGQFVFFILAALIGGTFGFWKFSCKKISKAGKGQI